MPRAADFNRLLKDAAEAKYPHRVSIPCGGTGRRLTDQLGWCHQYVVADAWDYHSHRERRRDGTFVDFARFYFANEADAEAFRRRWL